MYLRTSDSMVLGCRASEILAENEDNGNLGFIPLRMAPSTASQ